MEERRVYIRVTKINGKYFAAFREESGYHYIWPTLWAFGYKTEYECLAAVRRLSNNGAQIFDHAIFDTHLY